MQGCICVTIGPHISISTWTSGLDAMEAGGLQGPCCIGSACIIKAKA